MAIHPNKDGQLEMFDTLETALETTAPAPKKRSKKKKDLCSPAPIDLSVADSAMVLEQIVRIEENPDPDDNVIPTTPTRNLITVDNIEAVLNEALTQEVIDDLSDKPDPRPLPAVNTISDELVMNAIGSKLTAYDRAVLEALYSEIHASEGKVNSVFPVRSVYRTMCGNKELRCSESQKEDVVKAVTKLMTTVVSVEISGTTANGVKAGIKKKMPVIPATIEEIYIAGNKSTSIRITGNPEFLNYAYSQRGIVTTPKKLLGINIKNTKRSIAITNYLHHQLANVLYSEQAEQNRARLEDPDILYLDYETIYEIGQITPLAHLEKGVKRKYSPTYCSRTRDMVREVLSYWKSEHYIVDWSEKSGGKGTAIEGCYIHLPKPEDVIKPDL